MMITGPGIRLAVLMMIGCAVMSMAAGVFNNSNPSCRTVPNGVLTR